ncbi:MAG: Flp family type IVb pilin [Lachnospiraceae bacterium]
MNEMMNWLKDEESGQGMAEYALILALIAVVAVVALRPLGQKINEIFGSVKTELGGATK